MEKKVARINVSYQLVKAQLELDTATTKEAMKTLRAKYEMGEEQVKALIAKR